MLGPLLGTRALVIGAATDAGRAVARALGDNGAQIVLLCTNNDESGDIEASAGAIRAAGGFAHCLQADPNDRMAMAAVFADCIVLMDGLDVVFDARPNPPCADIHAFASKAGAQVVQLGDITEDINAIVRRIRPGTHLA